MFLSCKFFRNPVGCTAAIRSKPSYRTSGIFKSEDESECRVWMLPGALWVDEGRQERLVLGRDQVGQGLEGSAPT